MYLATPFDPRALFIAHPELEGRLHYYPKIDSTNLEAKRLWQADDQARDEDRALSSGDIVLADFQTQGRGRRGNHWQGAAYHSLLMTIVLEPDAAPLHWSKLALASAVALIEVAQQHGLNAQMKWPNDVLIEGKKCAGILIETLGEAAFIGIGLNVFKPDSEQGKGEGKEGELGTCWQEHAAHDLLRERLVGAIYQRVFAWATRLEDGQLIERANQLHCLQAQRVELYSGEQRYTGEVQGISESGALILKTSDAIMHIAQGYQLRKL